jgi:PAS domain S-box-containing protein
MLAGIGVFGIVDGSRWRALLTPTLAYRPAVLFGLTLVFGWRGFAWSQLLFFASFGAFLGWKGAALVTPLFLLSHACALIVARRLARNQPWLSGERSTLAFLAGAVLAPAVPALLNSAVLPHVGIPLRASVPTTVDGWLRGAAGILAVAPALLVYLSGPLKGWTALEAERARQSPITKRNVLELGVEAAVWTATLWMTVHFKAWYGLNISYLTFLPPLAFTLFRGMRPATLALAANAIIATTLWRALHWEQALPVGDLRLLIAIYSTTILVLAAVVDERERSRRQVEKLRTAEAVLGESEKHFRTLANSAPVMIWMTGEDNLCTFVNKRWLDFTGHSQEQELGKGWTCGLHPEDFERCRATTHAAIGARRSYSVVCRFRRADGEYRWILDNGVPLYRDGRFAGYIGSCVDITEQKIATERLRESEEASRENEQRLTSIYNTVRDVVFHLAVEPEGQFRFVSVNAAFLRVTGLSRDAVVGKTVNEVIPEPSLTMVLGKYRQAIEERAVVVWEEISEYPTGRLTGEISVAPVFDSKGHCTHLVGSVHDITELVKAGQLLRESEKRLKNAERLAHVGHWDWDIGTQRLSWSEECYRILGASRSDTQGYEGLLQTVAPPDQRRVAQWIGDCLAEKRGGSIEFQIVRPNGDPRTITCVSEVSLDDDGSPARLFGACQDVTDARRAQEELFARQKLETVGTLANGIAHDFNNLLGGVLAQTELAQAELASGSAPEEELKAIQSVAIHGSEIVRQLMIYAGTESAVAGLIDLSNTVDEMLSLLTVSVTKHATIQVDLDRGLPAIRASAAQLRQIVMNLITNASDAVGDRDGVIRVSTRRVTVNGESAASASRALADGDYVLLEVSDTGRGMCPETQARAFDPFFTTKSAGRGLGLAVVQGIVRSLDGAIQLTSGPDKGATFQILLPCAEDATSARACAATSARESPASSRQGVVLVVEDEAPLRQAVVKMLCKTGFEVVEAADGSCAIDLLRAHGDKIDVILLDMTIPGATSQEIVAEAANTSAKIRVILTSAYSREMIADGMNAPQIRSFIRKPFQLGDLVKTLRSSLSS